MPAEASAKVGGAEGIDLHFAPAKSSNDGGGCRPAFMATTEPLNHFYFGNLIGGAEGSRTLDLCIANAALSQLSYGPIHIENRLSNKLHTQRQR